MLEREQGRMVQVDFGWALERPMPPERHDLFWVHEATGDVYKWDGDGWYRMRPADNRLWKT